jgi:DnaJ homolog subfamily B member 12
MFSTIMGLLPILLLFIFPLLSSIFSGESYPSTPSMVFDQPSGIYTMERTMPSYGYKYYLNPRDVSSYNPSKLQKLDKQAEVILVRELNLRCGDEEAHKQRLREAARGWFGPDPEKMEVANSYHMPNCVRLKSLGRRS